MLSKLLYSLYIVLFVFVLVNPNGNIQNVQAASVNCTALTPPQCVLQTSSCFLQFTSTSASCISGVSPSSLCSNQTTEAGCLSNAHGTTCYFDTITDYCFNSLANATYVFGCGTGSTTSSSLSAGAIAGIVIGSVVGAALILVGVGIYLTGGSLFGLSALSAAKARRRRVV